MSVSSYFEEAARQAENMLRGRWTPLYLEHVTPAQELANRAMTRALVSIDGEITLAPGEGASARQIIEETGWGDAWRYRNDVPGRLRTFSRLALERDW